MSINDLSVAELLMYAKRQIAHNDNIKKYREDNPTACRDNQRRYYQRKKAAKIAELQATENELAIKEAREPTIITAVPPKGSVGRPKGAKNKPKSSTDSSGESN